MKLTLAQRCNPGTGRILWRSYVTNFTLVSMWSRHPQKHPWAEPANGT